MSDVLAPCSGTVRPLAEAPDPVFAAEMVGSGCAIEPELAPGVAVAPISGKIVKAHPHALAIVGPDGTGVLLHLGIDTVRLKGEGFELLVQNKASVEAGQEVVRWDPGAVAGQGLSPWVLVCVFDTKPGDIVSSKVDEPVDVGDVLFTWPTTP